MTTTDSTDSTDFADEVILPDFEEALWVALHAEHADDGTVAVGAPPPRHRGALLVAAVLVVGVLGAGAALARRSADDRPTVVGAAAAGGDDTAAPPGPTAGDDTAVPPGPTAEGGDTAVPPEPSSPAAPPTGVEGDVPVTSPPDLPAPPATAQARAAAEAIRRASDTTIQVTETTERGVVARRSWGDDVSGGTRGLVLRGDGTPKFELGLAEAPAAEGALAEPPVRAIDHCAGEWSEGPGPIVGGLVRGIAQQVDAGELVLDGTELVDGRRLIATHSLVLVTQVDPETGELIDEHWEDGQEEGGIYLDPDTLLPALDVSWIGAPNEQRTTYSYLDRTDPAARAMLVAPIPDGYARVDRVRTDDERAAAGCL